MPGRNWATLQVVPANAIKPACRAGRNPQFTNEDLPLPDEPTTARNCVAANVSTIASTLLSRPKKEVLLGVTERPQAGEWIAVNSCWGR